jgi:hypothetical protein
MKNGQQWVFDTRATSLQLPDAIRPTNGQAHEFNWQVTTARRSPEGAHIYGAMSVIYTFNWQ